jgi:MoxR-like ATPase
MPTQLLYTQLLRDKLQETLSDAGTLAAAADRLAQEEDVFFSMRFLLQRPLLKAILSEQPTVLLIDEIDRADAEFEAFLLEVLSDFQVSVPELGTLAAVHRPLVFLTSNNTRELSEALKRRCLYLFIGYPSVEQELAVVQLKVPELAPKLARSRRSISCTGCAASTCASRPASARRWTGPRRWWRSTQSSSTAPRWTPR